MTADTSESFRLPLQQQDLLLRATISPRDEAIKAWQEWCAVAEVSARDIGSDGEIDSAGQSTGFSTGLSTAELLPGLLSGGSKTPRPPVYFTRLFSPFYRRMMEWRVHSPQNELVTRIYQKTRLRNMYLLSELQRVLARLQENNIEALLIKGGAMLLKVTEDTGYRYCGDIDIVVRQSDFARAFAVLEAAGFKDPYRTSSDAKRWNHAHLLCEQPDIRFDLHLSPSQVWHRADFSECIWEKSSPCVLGDVSVRIPSLTDLFFLVCVHGATQHVREKYWLIDAARIIERAIAIEQPLDWERVRFLAKSSHARHLIQPVLDDLNGYGFDLAGIWDGGAATGQLTILEKLDSYWRSHGTDGVSGGFRARVSFFIRRCTSRNECFSVPAMLSYLRYDWKLNSNAEVLRRTLTLSVRTLYRGFFASRTTANKSR